MASRKLIAANWKENPGTLAEALRLFRISASAKRGKNVEVVICAPFVYLSDLSRAYKRLRNKKQFSIGAQDIFWEDGGPYTGEIGPAMLRSLGATYVIVGHSERRRWQNESDAVVSEKARAALTAGFKTILCVGEPLEVHKRGGAAARAFVAGELAKSLAGVRALKQKRGNLVIAYEPIWAISGGRNDPGNRYDDPNDAAAMISFIKSRVRRIIGREAPVLYGGSANIKNIADYVQYKEIDGALVGGASLRAGEFKKMIATVSKIQ